MAPPPIRKPLRCWRGHTCWCAPHDGAPRLPCRPVRTRSGRTHLSDMELTYACNLSCVHCLSSSGRRDPRELSTAQCKEVIDELERMQVFYVNIGGGEPTVRPDFWELVDYATEPPVGVEVSTN